MKKLLFSLLVAILALPTALNAANLTDFAEISRNITNGGFRQEMNLSINGIEITGLEAAGISLSEWLPLISNLQLQSVIRYNDGDSTSVTTSLALADNSLIDLELYASDQIVAARVPQFFDNFIFAETDTLIADLHSSALGELLGLGLFTLEELAELQDHLLTGNLVQVVEIDLTTDLFLAAIRLAQSATIIEMDNEIFEIDGTSEEFTAQQIIISLADLNDILLNLSSAFLSQLGINNTPTDWDSLGLSISDTDVTLTIFESTSRSHLRIMAAFSIWDTNNSVEIVFINEDVLQFTLNAEFDEGSSFLTYNMGLTFDMTETSADNFLFNATIFTYNGNAATGTRISFDVLGNVQADETTIRADFGDISLTVATGDWITSTLWQEEPIAALSLSADFLLTVDNSPINFNRNAATHINDLTQATFDGIQQRYEAWLFDMLVQVLLGGWAW